MVFCQKMLCAQRLWSLTTRIWSALWGYSEVLCHAWRHFLQSVLSNHIQKDETNMWPQGRMRQMKVQPWTIMPPDRPATAFELCSTITEIREHIVFTSKNWMSLSNVKNLLLCVRAHFWTAVLFGAGWL